MVRCREALAAIGILGMASQGLAAEVSRHAIETSNWPKPQDEAASSCPDLGPGYIRIAGSATCVKLSGRVRVETGFVRR